jgi:hypothetical protein
MELVANLSLISKTERNVEMCSLISDALFTVLHFLPIVFTFIYCKPICKSVANNSIRETYIFPTNF